MRSAHTQRSVLDRLSIRYSSCVTEQRTERLRTLDDAGELGVA